MPKTTPYPSCYCDYFSSKISRPVTAWQPGVTLTILLPGCHAKAKKQQFNDITITGKRYE